MTRGVAWPALMQAGIRGLGLRPSEFWALSPGELLFMLGEGDRPAPLGRARLVELERAFAAYGEKRDG